MKKFGKRPNRGIEYVNEDDVAKALLNKRTEVALYKDVDTKKEEQRPMTQTEYRQAEESMSSALDMLRKERGQKTIEQEEIEYNFNQKLNEFDLFDDLTSDSVTTQMNLAMVHKALEKDESEEDLDTDTDLHDDKKKLRNGLLKKRSKTSKKKAKSVSKTDKHKIVSNTDKLDKVSNTNKIDKVSNTSKQKKVSQTSKISKIEKTEKKEKKPISPVVKIVAALVVLGLALMGGYAYKLYVYDPQNVVSEEQQLAYNRLVAYADEFDMMSESEKLELLDMTDDYDSLLRKQKSAINDYFKDSNHVGKTYSALIKELKQLKDSLEDESSQEFQELKKFLEGWAGYDDSGKRLIINYKKQYDSLNTTLKKKIDDVARVNCTKSFLTLYNEYHEVIKSENSAQISINNDRISELESQLENEKSSLDEYKKYDESLQRDLDSVKQNGQDTSTLEEQINTNNQMIEQSQQSVDNIQSEIDNLKAQNDQLASI